MTGVTITVHASGTCTTHPFNVAAAEPPPQQPPPPGNDVLSNPTLKLWVARVNVPVIGVVATFSDSNPSAYIPGFTAVIDWGDGTQTDGAISSPWAGALNVSAPAGGHFYAAPPRAVTVSVSLSALGVTESTATGKVWVLK